MNIADIPNIDQEVKDLLGAVGCLQVSSLAAKNPNVLYNELVKANEILKISDNQPDLSDVERWVSAAAHDLGVEAEPNREESVEPSRAESIVKINIKGNEQIAELLKIAPVAEKLKGHLVRNQSIAVLDIPEAILLDDCDETLEINTEKGRVSLSEIASGSYDLENYDSSGESLNSDAEIAKESAFHDFDAINNGEHHIKPLDRGPRKSDEIGSDLNKNVDIGSRRFIKGVLHPEPWRVKGPAILVILFQVSLGLNLIGQPYIFINKFEDKVDFIAAGVLFGVLVVSFTLWLLVAGMSACRVCGQKQFRLKQCIKHKDAHRFPLLGHMLPTALQALLFHWFYCIYCGTAIRLKK
ncbi:DUF4332 domain-containing protein [Akkermansiaceae bacterium]|nr:DUF4332 domain-containing protein [Akkermansiaceae bacterium]